MLGVREACTGRVAVDQRACVERREQPLVRVDDERVGEFHPGEHGPHPLHEHRGEAVRAVDVQPDSSWPWSRSRSTRCRRRSRSWWCRRSRRPRTRIRGSLRAPLRPPRPAGARRRPDGTPITSMSMTAAADAIDECASLLHTTAHRAGSGRPISRLRRRAASRAVTSAERLPIVPPCMKTPSGALRQTELGREPVQHLVLGEDGTRALHPRTAVDRGRRHHEVECDGRLRRRRGDEREIGGVIGRHARGCEHVLEEGGGPARADARRADRPRSEPREVPRRQRLVERNVLVERASARVVEHLVDGRSGLVRDGMHSIGLRSWLTGPSLSHFTVGVHGRRSNRRDHLQRGGLSRC